MNISTGRCTKVFREAVGTHEDLRLAASRSVHADGVGANFAAVVRSYDVRAHVLWQTVRGQVAANFLDRIINRAPRQRLFVAIGLTQFIFDTLAESAAVNAQ